MDKLEESLCCKVLLNSRNVAAVERSTLRQHESYNKILYKRAETIDHVLLSAKSFWSKYLAIKHMIRLREPNLSSEEDSCLKTKKWLIFGVYYVWPTGTNQLGSRRCARPGNIPENGTRIWIQRLLQTNQQTVKPTSLR